MRDLTPAAWEFLGDVARRYGIDEARALRDLMTDGTITHLDDRLVRLGCDAQQLALPIAPEQLRLELAGGRAA